MKTTEIILLIEHFYLRESYERGNYYSGLVDGFLISIGLYDLIGKTDEIEKTIGLWKAMRELRDA